MATGVGYNSETHGGRNRVTSVSLCICVFMCMVSLLFFEKVHNLFCFKINVFLHNGKESLEGQQKEAFVHDQEQNKAKFLYLQDMVYYTRTSVCGIVSLVI